MRARNIKPDLFKDEDLGECSIPARLLFAGLWCLGDREGRLRDRPKWIKAELFPYDSIEVDPLLNELAEAGVIKRYEVGGVKVIWCVNFKKHQKPHVKEKASELPAFSEQSRAGTGAEPAKVGVSTDLGSADNSQGSGKHALNPECGMRNPECGILNDEDGIPEAQPSSSQSVGDIIFECQGDPPSLVVNQRQIDVWGHAYPNVDVRAEVLKARATLVTSGDRRTRTATIKFLNNWMQNTVHRPSARGSPQSRNREPVAVGKEVDPSAVF